jgi:glycosyltransferase involved in cell wall biosynthesis
MKFSIITVCYNSSETIEKTFISIKNQTYKNIEYIVVDGGSSDGTLELIDKYKSIIAKTISEADDGLYDAMNKGIGKATGEIIGFLNSDDIFTSNTVIEEIAYFHMQNDIDASIGNILQLSADGEIMRFYTSKYWVPDSLKFGFMPPHPSIFIKRMSFEVYGGFNCRYIIASDFELILRYFLLNKIRWKYHDIITTSMQIGGISSSGIISYKLITREMSVALSSNSISYSKTILWLRFVWKFFGYLRKKIH